MAIVLRAAANEKPLHQILEIITGKRNNRELVRAADVLKRTRLPLAATLREYYGPRFTPEELVAAALAKHHTNPETFRKVVEQASRLPPELFEGGHNSVRLAAYRTALEGKLHSRLAGVPVELPSKQEATARQIIAHAQTVLPRPLHEILAEITATPLNTARKLDAGELLKTNRSYLARALGNYGANGERRPTRVELVAAILRHHQDDPKAFKRTIMQMGRLPPAFFPDAGKNNSAFKVAQTGLFHRILAGERLNLDYRQSAVVSAVFLRAGLKSELETLRIQSHETNGKTFSEFCNRNYDNALLAAWRAVEQKRAWIASLRLDINDVAKDVASLTLQRAFPAYNSKKSGEGTFINNLIKQVTSQFLKSKQRETRVKPASAFKEKTFASTPLDWVDTKQENPELRTELAEQAQHTLGKYLQRLSTSERDALTLEFGLDGQEPLDRKQISQEKGCTTEAVRQNRERAIGKLRLYARLEETPKRKLNQIVGRAVQNANVSDEARPGIEKIVLAELGKLRKDDEPGQAIPPKAARIIRTIAEILSQERELE